MSEPDSRMADGTRPADASPRPEQPAPETGPPPWGELSLSEERWAFLAPRLRALVEDFRRLEALERPELEPATTGWRDEDDDDERR